MIQSIDSSVLVQQKEAQYVEGEQTFQLSCIHLGLKLEYLGHTENLNGATSSYAMNNSNNATFSGDSTTSGMTTCAQLNHVYESTSSSAISQPYLIVAPPASYPFIEHASDILLTLYAAQYIYGDAKTIVYVLKHKVLLPQKMRQHTLNFRMDDGLLVDGVSTSVDQISRTIDGVIFQEISMSSAGCGSCCSSPSKLAHLSEETSLLYPKVEWPYVSCGEDTGGPSTCTGNASSKSPTCDSKYDGMIASLVLGAIITATFIMKDALSAITYTHSTETDATSNIGESVTDISSMVDVIDSEVSRQSPTEGFMRRSTTTTTPLGKGSRLLSSSKEWQRDRAGRLNRSKV